MQFGECPTHDCTLIATCSPISLACLQQLSYGADCRSHKWGMSRVRRGCGAIPALLH